MTGVLILDRVHWEPVFHPMHCSNISRLGQSAALVIMSGSFQENLSKFTYKENVAKVPADTILMENFLYVTGNKIIWVNTTCNVLRARGPNTISQEFKIGRAYVFNFSKM